MNKSKSLPIPLWISISILLLSLPNSQSSPDLSPTLIQQVTTQKHGVCEGVNPAAITCPYHCFRVDPVCGVDGVTYWCGCGEATCANKEVAKRGACELGLGNSDNNSASFLPGQALLLVHLLWLFLLGFALCFGFL